MTILFAGGEDHDFTRLGITAVDTATTSARRTAYARCSLKSGPGAATDGWQCAFASSSTFWATARGLISQPSGSTGYDTIAFLDGANRRLILTADSTADHWRLVKRDSALTQTTLATSSVLRANSMLSKYDVYINYGTSGNLKFYIDGTLVIDYSGDLTTNSATTLSGMVLGSAYSGGPSNYWSEVIVATDDTRSMSLVTLPPAANGNAWAWSNDYTKVNEVTTDDTGIATASTAGLIAETTVTSSGITGNPAIRAVCLSARAQRGGTGPQSADLVVRTGGADYFSSDIALPASLGRIANVWETNPATGNPWAYTDLTAAGFNIGIKSIA